MDVDWVSVYAFSTPFQVHKHSACQKKDIKASEIVTELFASLEVGQKPAHTPACTSLHLQSHDVENRRLE